MGSNIALPALFSLVFVGIGCAILMYGRSLSSKAQASLDWLSVEGEIAHSAVLLERDRAGSGNRISKADIVYRYKVGGRDYSSTTISVCDMGAGSRYAESIVERYPDKLKVKVYYDPSDPSDSLLEPGDAAGVKLLSLIGGGFLAGGLFFLVMSLTGHVNVQPLQTRMY
jgi:hypothetical protein